MSESPVTNGHWYTRLYSRAMALWTYCSSDVWHDPRQTFRVRVIKTLNLTARSFMDSDLQSQACALTYRTLLAIVPALALVFAICRGFGFQNLLSEQLFKIFPSQRHAINVALQFVDSYLSQAAEGVFVGIGILFLLWTLISLLGNVEDTFNRIWHVQDGRTLWRKVTDYLAIFLILPVIMICAGGLSIMMGTTLKILLPFGFMDPVVNLILDGISLILTWLFFAGAYMMIPNTRVRFVNALIAGIMVGTAFQVIQWLFLSGQLYVSKYNAIYGSFSFLPLLLIWLQLTWLITLTGALVCYASQRAGQFDYYKDVDNISIDYRRRAILVIMTLIARRYVMGYKPMGTYELSRSYGIPPGLTLSVTEQLHRVGLIDYVVRDKDAHEPGMIPAVDVSRLTVGKLIARLQRFGSQDFIPAFDTTFKTINTIADNITDAMSSVADKTIVGDIDIPLEINIPQADKPVDTTSTL